MAATRASGWSTMMWCSLSGMTRGAEAGIMSRPRPISWWRMMMAERSP